MHRLARRLAPLLSLLFVAAVFVAAPATVAAAAKKGKKKAKGAKADAALTEAKALFAEGKTFFDSGQFDKALGAYTAAYEKKPLPGFLINIGQCHRNLKNFEQAIFFYNKFLEDEPSTPLRAEVEGIVADLKVEWKAFEESEAKRIAAEKAASDASKEAEAKERASLEAIRASEAASAARADAEAAKARAAEAKVRKPFYQRAWFWSVIGGAIVAGATLVTLGFVLSPTLPDTSLGTVDCRGMDVMSCEIR